MLTNDVQYLFEGVLICDTYVNRVATFSRHHVVLLSCLDHGRSHLDFSKRRRCLWKPVASEPFNIFDRFVYRIYALLPGSVSGFPMCNAVKNHQPLLSDRHLAARRFAYNGKVNWWQKFPYTLDALRS